MRENTEFSERYPRYPKYYKGYDMDELFRKVDEQEFVTEIEEDLILEVLAIYDVKHDAEMARDEEERRRKAKEAGLILPAPTRCPPWGLKG